MGVLTVLPRLASSDPPALASQSTGITGVNPLCPGHFPWILHLPLYIFSSLFSLLSPFLLSILSVSSLISLT